jgi:type I restriction enzyme M protein
MSTAHWYPAIAGITHREEWNRMSQAALDLSISHTDVLLRRDLRAPTTLTQRFAHIRNLLAGRTTGSTLDHILVDQLIDLLFCKIYDEQTTRDDMPVAFQYRPDDNEDSFRERFALLFERVKNQSHIGYLFEKSEALTIDQSALRDCVVILQNYEISASKRDIIGEAFETFIGPNLRGNEGQFFTPRNVVQLTTAILNPKPGELILDPACGTGGFLTEALRSNGASEIRAIGIDKDRFLSRLAAIQLYLFRKDDSSTAFCANSLASSHNWPNSMRGFVAPNSVDVLMTNPPFGSNISVDREILESHRLGRIWARSSSTEGRASEWIETSKSAPNRAPQIVFVERCIYFLRPGGRMGIVLPDSIFGNESLGYVRQYVRQVADVVAMIDLPLETFLPSTSTKTSLLFLRKKNGVTQENVFMAIAAKCGHNRRGKPIYRGDGSADDDFPLIAQAFADWKAQNANDF